MGTRAFIEVEGSEIGLYKHYDGYIKGTLPWLEDFFTEFYTKRGYDPEYCLAQLIRSSAFKADKFNLDKSTETGWGVMLKKDKPGDVEYTYKLCRNGSIYISSKD